LLAAKGIFSNLLLPRHREDILKRRRIESDIETQLAALEQSLRSQPRGRYGMAVAGD
jgi:hypothetical protein